MSTNHRIATMNRLEQFHPGFLIICALVCAGIAWGCSDAAVDAPASEPEEDVLDLVQLIEDIHSFVFLTHSPEYFDDAAAAGRTAAGYYYGLFTGKAASSWAWAIGFSGLDKINRPHCELKAGGGWRAQKKFADCIKGIMDGGSCVLLYRDEDGNTHAEPAPCPEDEG